MLLTATIAPAQEPQFPPETLLHTRTEFSFTVDAPFHQVAPLFFCANVRKWASHWNPQFIYPSPCTISQAWCLRLRTGTDQRYWLTLLYLAAGHIQYAYVINDAMAVLIDIHLTRQSAQKTGVTSLTERTALMPESNEHGQHFAKDAGSRQGVGR